MKHYTYTYTLMIYIFHILFIAIPLLYYGFRGQSGIKIDMFGYVILSLLGGMALVFHGYWFAGRMIQGGSKINDIISTWKHQLPKKMVKKYVEKFGLPYDYGKDQVIWKNMAGFDKTWIVDEEVEHTYPVDHIDFVYSTKKVQGIKPEHVCTIANATGSIFIDMLKQEATARCHYLVKNAVSLSFVEDVIAGKISQAGARDEYAKRILSNQYHSWFKDPLKEAEVTLGEGKHHLLLSG